MSEDPREQPRHEPLSIDYYAANAPSTLRPDPLDEPRGTWLGTLFLVCGWVPFVCGVLSAGRLSKYAPTSWLAAENNGVVVLMGFGCFSTFCAMFAYLRSGHASQTGFAGFSLLLQLGIAICMHGAR